MTSGPVSQSVTARFVPVCVKIMFIGTDSVIYPECISESESHLTEDPGLADVLNLHMLLAAYYLFCRSSSYIYRFESIVPTIVQRSDIHHINLLRFLEIWYWREDTYCAGGTIRKSLCSSAN